MATVEEPTFREPHLDVQRQLKYFVRCLRSPLPSDYLSTEGNRMYLGYLILSAIDLLTPVTASAPPSAPSSSTNPQPTNTRTVVISPEERCCLRKWVLSNQSPAGGFCGTPSLGFQSHEHSLWEDFGSSVPGGGQVPPLQRANMATIASTAFALQILALLADDIKPVGKADNVLPAKMAFDGIDRRRTLEWLAKLQRADGSFGEALRGGPLAQQPEGAATQTWFVTGGYDMRYCYLAAMIRWILRGDVADDPSDPAWVQDIDVPKMVRYIRSCQAFDGGFGENEAHAGYTYCAIGALYLLDLQNNMTDHPDHPSQMLHNGVADFTGLVRWLASRQFVYLDPPGRENDTEDEAWEEPVNYYQPALSSTCGPGETAWLVAFNGRDNKVADTCYTFWVAGAVNLLRHGLAGRRSPDHDGHDDEQLATLHAVLAHQPARRFLLERTVHRVMGGFGKNPGDHPDLYHGCLGLAALALLSTMSADRGGPSEPALKVFDPALAVSAETTAKIVLAREKLLHSARQQNGRSSHGPAGSAA